jgi:hypothetical protein
MRLNATLFFTSMVSGKPVKTPLIVLKIKTSQLKASSIVLSKADPH